MPIKFGRWWRQAAERIIPSEPDVIREERPDDDELLRQAHQEWMAARTLFEHVSEPELVDQAIHRLVAAEKRYVYLWKEKRAGVQGTGKMTPLSS